MQRLRRILWEGMVTGLIGAVSVAVWFLIVDGAAGRPFYTPAVLGSAATLGLRDPTTVVITLQSVGAYTAFHVLAFFAVGIRGGLVGGRGGEVTQRSLARGRVLHCLRVRLLRRCGVGFHAAAGPTGVDQRGGREPDRRGRHGLLSVARSPLHRRAVDGPRAGDRLTGRLPRVLCAAQSHCVAGTRPLSAMSSRLSAKLYIAN